MSTDELAKLTPEQKRIRIAELCPTIIRKVKDKDVHGGGWWQFRCKGHWRDCLYNNPLGDLNAMHEAEETLDRSDRRQFDNELTEITTKNRLYGGAGFDVLHATAAQRADAFLLTLG